MKKVISLKKFWALVFAIFACHSAWAYFEADGIYYDIISEDDRTVEVVDYNDGGNYSGELIIPSKVNLQSKDYTVVAIGEEAFYGCERLISINISDGITSIGGWAFWNCVNLTSIKLPNSLISIGEYAFFACKSLASIELPDGLTSIGQYAFYFCESLSFIDIPDGVTSIGEGAFGLCRSLTSIELPDGLTSIEQNVFGNCANLTSIELPDGLISIGPNAFGDCTNLTSIELPDGLTSIGQYAFYNCASLTSIELPDGLTYIGPSAFKRCASLTYINIPDGVTSIEEYTFFLCKNLTSIDIPSSMACIGSSAFKFCGSLTSVYCRANIPPSANVDSFGDDALEELDDDALKATLYVPIGTKADYEAVDPWRNFWTIEETDFTAGVEDVVHGEGVTVATDGNSIVVTGDDAGRIEVYSVNGQCVYSGNETTISGLAKGVYIVKVGNKAYKVIIGVR